MANTEHIKWLRQGVQKWNERRMSEDFEPSLEEADIAWFNEREMNKWIPVPGDMVDLSGVNLRHAKLQRAELGNVNLSNADLFRADLTDSHLNGAVLKGANLVYADLGGARTSGWADFSDAKLVCANLSSADFSGTDFRNAILAEATLDGTDLRHALLAGANLSRTQLWNTELFSCDPNITPPLPLSYESIHQVSDLLNACREVRGRYDNENVRFYFRGESCANWKLRPSVKRDGDFRIAEAGMLVDLMSRRPEEFGKLNSGLAQWVLAQHHGLKTRLLDVTRNPLVALFHACEASSESGRVHVFAVNGDLVKPFNSDTISILANFAKLAFDDQELLLTKQGGYDAHSAEFPRAIARLYHLIRQEKPHFQERIDPKDFFRVFVIEPQRSFERIRAQSGAFLISAFHERFEPDAVLKWNNGIPIYDHYALEVPYNDKEKVIEELSHLNITSETLFPGLNEAARAVMERLNNQ